MNSVGALEKSTRIRVLNDNFRTTFLGGRVVMTAGVADLSLGVRAQVVLKVQDFADFNADNDPYGAHDFGSFEVAGETRRAACPRSSAGLTNLYRASPVCRGSLSSNCRCARVK